MILQYFGLNLSSLIVYTRKLILFWARIRMINDHHDLKAMAITSTISLIFILNYQRLIQGVIWKAQKADHNLGMLGPWTIQEEFCDSWIMVPGCGSPNIKDYLYLSLYSCHVLCDCYSCRISFCLEELISLVSFSIGLASAKKSWYPWYPSL